MLHILQLYNLLSDGCMLSSILNICKDLQLEVSLLEPDDMSVFIFTAMYVAMIMLFFFQVMVNRITHHLSICHLIQDVEHREHFHVFVVYLVINHMLK